MTIEPPDINTIRRTLAVHAAAISGQPVHALAFVTWATGNANEAASLLIDISSAKGALKNPTHSAAAGYVAALSVDGALDLFLGDLERLQRRAFFERKPFGHEVDGLVLLGIALGLRAIGADNVRQEAITWLSNLVDKAVAAAPSGDWNATLIRAAGIVVGTGGPIPGAFAPEMTAALAARGVIPFNVVPRAAAWQAVTEPDIPDDGPSRAAARLAAYDHLWRTGATASLASISVEDVARVLERIPASMNRWPWENSPKTTGSAAAKWVIDNEYHVQSLLWTILSPFFRDLRSEEYTPSVGQKHPRVDIAIPELEAVIEVKFIRVRTKFADIIEEIAADASLYLQQESSYRHLIAFYLGRFC